MVNYLTVCLEIYVLCNIGQQIMLPKKCDLCSGTLFPGSFFFFYIFCLKSSRFVAVFIVFSTYYYFTIRAKYSHCTFHILKDDHEQIKLFKLICFHHIFYHTVRSSVVQVAYVQFAAIYISIEYIQKQTNLVSS